MFSPQMPVTQEFVTSGADAAHFGKGGTMEKMEKFDKRLELPWWALKIGLGVGPIITGADKFFNRLTDWTMYLSPLATKVVPVSPSTFMHVVGVVEIIAGLVVLSRYTKIGAYVVSAWLLGIVVNLLTMGMFFDLAMRDVEIAIGAFALAQLTRVREESLASAPSRSVVASQFAVNR